MGAAFGWLIIGSSRKRSTHPAHEAGDSGCQAGARSFRTNSEGLKAEWASGRTSGMTEVHVLPQTPGRFDVQCLVGDTATRHSVTVPERLLEEIGLPRLDPMHLVEETFAYLLEREPNTAILEEFDLADVARFFPGFVAEMRDRLRCS
jgi:hypothetical protein